jgi:anti-sigma28 factor (negative regulator of flagellin synthesis)
MRVDRIIMEPKNKPSLRAILGNKITSRGVVLSPEMGKPLELVSQQVAKAEKINALRAQVQDGSYKIDFDKLAAKIMGEGLSKLK